MANDIGNRGLGISDRCSDPLINVPQSHDTLEFNEHDDYHFTSDQQEKEAKRMSLPTERRSKLSSWVQHSLPTPPSSRNNSNSSKHRGWSSNRSSTASTSDQSSTSLPSPTCSPTSIASPQLPPPRSSSLKSSPTTINTVSLEEKAEPSQHRRSSSTSSDNKKKRFLPMVPRVRLCQSEKCCKKKNHILLDPPEPPPQLLITALHYHNQNVKKKSASHNNLQQQQTSHEKDPATKSPPLSPSICHQEQPTRDDNKLTLDDASYPRRRRSSCPSKYFTNITVQESVMLQSFCSSVNSPQHEPRTSSSSPPSKTAGITTTSSPPPSTITTSSTSSSSSTLAQPDVYDVDNQCILAFSTMKPRSRPLRRRTSGKKEKKAFRVWHDTLVESLKSEPGSNSLKSVNRVSSTSSMEQQSDLSKEKRERMALTRKFILSEIYLTEVTFWNQLYYSKVMFSDPLQKSLEQKSPFVRSSDMDIFSNLSDLMHCSSQLIRAMTPYLDHPSIDPTNLPPEASILSRTDTFDQQQQQYHKVRPTSYSTIRSSTTLPSPTTSTSSSSSSSSLSSSSTNTTFSKSTQSNMLPIHLEADARTLPSPNDQLLLGKELCAMASHFVVFLRCALDYRSNRKRLDHRTQHNKGFAVYQEKLALRRETNQFYVHDYLIIPIQRVTRYGLLLADLQKHTDRNHPDYQYLSRARMILTSLAMAMNKAQQK